MSWAKSRAPQETGEAGAAPGRRRGPLAYLLAGVVVLACVGGGLWLWGTNRHPDAFSGLGFDGDATVTVGKTVTFPLTPDPWDAEHGPLHVRAVYPRVDGSVPQGTTLTVWRCERTNVGSPGGWAMGEQPIRRACRGALRVTGPFDLEASRGSREALLLAVTSPTPGPVHVTGVVIDYREGLRSGQQVIGLDGHVDFLKRHH